MQAETPVRVLGICGSLRRGSHTRKALAIALDGAADAGAQTRLMDLRDYHLPFCDGKHEDADSPPDVQRLRREVREAHGLILATPEYHGGLSGVLKNTLDLMGFREFEGKMIGLVGVSGGNMGAVNALNDLRAIGRSLHAWVIPEQASVPNVSRQFDETGAITDARLEERLREVGRQVARFAYLHSWERAREFIREWEHAKDNPGGR